MAMQLNEHQRRGSSAVFEEKPTMVAYKGAERRRRHRRNHTDRRLELRFELDKSDRRICAGRRAGDKNIKFW
ncbi:MAG: hypothetical protein OEV88_08340 [Gammaproteobacteria bacterium]|jgi:hypothetical protein|nr:hypothetical protein [Gammaproteobacteria bacterium]